MAKEDKRTGTEAGARDYAALSDLLTAERLGS